MDIEQIVATAIANALKGQKGAVKAKGKGKKAKGKGRSAKLTDSERAAYQAINDAETVKLFTAAGYKLVEPRINVLTYNKWIAAGRLVRKGQKGVRVGPFALFHIDQTDALPNGNVAQPTATAQTAEKQTAAA